jgi:hypothetical protein
VDGYRLSSYMYKDKDSKNRKFYFGPVWDFNHGYGNCDYYEASNIEGWQLDYQFTNGTFMSTDQFQPPFWWKKIVAEPSFRAQASARWKLLRSSTLSLPKIRTFVDSIAALINEAQQRNFVKWPILNIYVWPNVYIGGTYANEVAYLKSWIAQRFDWMDRELTGAPLSAVQAADQYPEGYTIEQNYPNPFNPSTSIEYRIGDRTHVMLYLYDALGRTVATLVDAEQETGVHRYNLSSNNFGLSSGIYFYHLRAGAYSAQRKMLILK